MVIAPARRPRAVVEHAEEVVEISAEVVEVSEEE